MTLQVQAAKYMTQLIKRHWNSAQISHPEVFFKRRKLEEVIRMRLAFLSMMKLVSRNVCSSIHFMGNQYSTTSLKNSKSLELLSLNSWTSTKIWFPSLCLKIELKSKRPVWTCWWKRSN